MRCYRACEKYYHISREVLTKALLFEYNATEVQLPFLKTVEVKTCLCINGSLKRHTWILFLYKNPPDTRPSSITIHRGIACTVKWIKRFEAWVDVIQPHLEDLLKTAGLKRKKTKSSLSWGTARLKNHNTNVWCAFRTPHEYNMLSYCLGLNSSCFRWGLRTWLSVRTLRAWLTFALLWQKVCESGFGFLLPSRWPSSSVSHRLQHEALRISPSAWGQLLGYHCALVSAFSSVTRPLWLCCTTLLTLLYVTVVVWWVFRKWSSALSFISLFLV